MNILYVINSYGLGHWTRSKALITEIEKINSQAEIIIATNIAFDFVTADLLKKHNFVTWKNEFGIYASSFEKIESKTLISINNYLSKYELIVNNFIEILTEYKIDAIITDVEASVIEAGNRINIPSLAISNFTWYEIFMDLNIKLSKLDLIKDSYEKSNFFYELPFSTEKELTLKKKKVGLLTRFFSDNRSNLRKKLGFTDSTLFIPNNNLVSKKLYNLKYLKPFIENDWQIAIYENLPNRELFPQYDKYITLPTSIKSNDVILASDFVIAKVGYGICSEILSSGTPLGFFYRSFFSEDKALIKGIKENSLGKPLECPTKLDFSIPTRQQQKKIHNKDIAIEIMKVLS